MGNRIKHYWTDSISSNKWHRKRDLPRQKVKSTPPTTETLDASVGRAHEVTAGRGIMLNEGSLEADTAPTLADQVSICFIQSNFRNTEGHGNFEAVAHLKSSDGKNDYLASYTFDASTLRWSGPYPITVNGHKITGVKQF